MAKKYYIVVSHPETDNKYFVRFNGFAAPTFSPTRENARIYDDDKTAYNDAVKLDEKIKKERGGEQCSVSVGIFRDMDNQCATEEAISKEAGWIHKFSYKNKNVPMRKLWIRFNNDTGNVQAAITGEDPAEIYEISDDHHDVACTYFNWVKSTFTKGLVQYEREQRANMPDMRP